MAVCSFGQGVRAGRFEVFFQNVLADPDDDPVEVLDGLIDGLMVRGRVLLELLERRFERQLDAVDGLDDVVVQFHGYSLALLKACSFFEPIV